MQTSIDQGPYLNVADGMVSAMGNEHIEVGEASEENKDHNHTAPTVSVADNQARKPDSPTNSAQTRTSEDDAGLKGSGMIQRCLHQITRQSNKSIWLLAYIAIISSWPVVGAALGFFYRRKMKNALLGRGPK